MQTSFQHTFHFRTNHHTDDSKPQTQRAEAQSSIATQRGKNVLPVNLPIILICHHSQKLCVLCSSAKNFEGLLPIGLCID